jgi:hypothetical protein
MMINTCACMFSTALTQKEVDKLSEAMLNGFRHIKPKLEALSKHQCILLKMIPGALKQPITPEIMAMFLFVMRYAPLLDAMAAVWLP